MDPVPSGSSPDGNEIPSGAAPKEKAGRRPSKDSVASVTFAPESGVVDLLEPIGGEGRQSRSVSKESVGAGRRASKDSVARRPSIDIPNDDASMPSEGSPPNQSPPNARSSSKDSVGRGGSPPGGRRPSKDIVGGRRPSKDGIGGRRPSKDGVGRRLSLASETGDDLSPSAEPPDNAPVEEIAPVVIHMPSPRNYAEWAARQDEAGAARRASLTDGESATDSALGDLYDTTDKGGRMLSKESHGRRSSKESNNNSRRASKDSTGGRRSSSKESNGGRASPDSDDGYLSNGVAGTGPPSRVDSRVMSRTLSKEDQWASGYSRRHSLAGDGFSDVTRRTSSKEDAWTHRSSTTLLGGLPFLQAKSVAQRPDAEATKQAARQRRGEVLKRRSVYEVLDDTFEKSIQTSTDCSWCLDACGISHGAPSRDNGRQVVVKAQNGTGAERHFGLPEFEASGYCISNPEEVQWPDIRVHDQLGFQQAIHRSTSIERFCFQKSKATVPLAVENEQIHHLVKALKKCDHANVLRCHEVYEDHSYIYLLYESIECMTLLSVLEDQSWTQEQVVNLVRECCAAFAYCSGIGLAHLGWTLSHVLIPVNCKDDPKYAKLYGFGLMGVIHNDIHDFLCWAPEALEAYHKVGELFATRLEGSHKLSCDMWSLGTIVYAIIARRPPILGKTEEVQMKILAHDWSINVAFDEFDSEAKQLVENLMHPTANYRMKAEATLFNAWIRRRWKSPQGAGKVFIKLEEFCSSSLVKRLFGRFLVQFLDPAHMAHVSKAFYALDNLGYGLVNSKDLSIACKSADRPPSAITTIESWMSKECGTISLARFAESMAEEVIDGTALRHSFESLDDDGSECISAVELFNELQPYFNALTIEDINAHMESSEVGIHSGTEAVSDHTLDYGEYVQLFPGRVRQVKQAEDRISSTREYATGLETSFNSVKAKVQAWIKALDTEANNVGKLQANMGEHGVEVIKDIKKRINKMAQLLAHPPGPTDLSNRTSSLQKQKKSKKKGQAVLAAEYGFDSFVQDHAIHSFWPVLLEGEKRIIRNSVHTQNGVEMLDVYKATDAVNFVIKKIDEVLEWTRFQLDEYEAIVDVLVATESALHTMVYSSRGLQKHDHANEHDADDEDNA